MDARNGPFLDPTALDASLAEMGRLALQAGEMINHFFEPKWPNAYPARLAFGTHKQEWFNEFYKKPESKAEG